MEEVILLLFKDARLKKQKKKKTPQLVQEKVYPFADKLENKDIHTSDGWFSKLKIIHEIECKVLCRKALSVLEETIKERKNENSIIFQDYER